MLKLVDKMFVEGCKCKDVSNSEILNYSNETIKEMIKIVKSNYSIGLAAPQVGIFRKFFIMKYGGNDNYITCFNPKIIFYSAQKSVFKEGCLTYLGSHSLNRPEKNIMRPKTIKVEYQNIDGDIITLKLRGLESKCFQHEFDHLSGKTIFFRAEEK